MITEGDSLQLDHIASLVKSARKRERLSQDQLAALASISRRPIYLLESGRGAVRLDTLIQILNALGLTLDIKPKGSALD